MGHQAHDEGIRRWTSTSHTRWDRKYVMSQVVGYIKGKTAIHMARIYAERRRNYLGRHFWARTDRGRDEEVIREYVRNRNSKTPGWSRWISGGDTARPPLDGRGAVSDPSRYERLRS